MHYLKSYFLIDLISIIPFDLFLTYNNQGHYKGLSKISKMYRLVRLTRMARMFKILNLKNNFIKKITDTLNIGLGTRRLLFMTLILMLL